MMSRAQRLAASFVASALVSVLSVTSLTGCADDPTRPPAAIEGETKPIPSGSGGGGADGGGTLDSGSDADVVCTTLENTGVVLDRVGVNGDPPVGIGGTVSDGRYDLTGYVVYVGVGGIAGPTGVTAKSSIRVAGGRVEQIILFAGSGTPTELATLGSFRAAGSTLTVTNLCPANGGVVQYQYTATDSVLTLTDPTSKEAFTFTKR